MAKAKKKPVRKPAKSKALKPGTKRVAGRVVPLKGRVFIKGGGGRTKLAKAKK